MLGYKGENVPVLGAFSDVSENESEEDESFHMLDPSDPRAHVKKTGNHTLPSTKTTSSTPTILSDVSDEDEDLSSLKASKKEEKTTTKPQVDIKDQLKSKLSKWALARFLAPRKEAPALVELPIEPLNDYILSDFGTRFRGDIDIEKDKEDNLEEEQEEIVTPTVGAPLFSSTIDEEGEDTGELIDGEDATKTEDNKMPGRKRRENRYFVTDLATKCFNCGQVGHVSNVCMNDKVLRPCYYCGLRGHVAMACPHTPCFSCYQLGHEARNCTNRRVVVSSCDICGRQGHRTLQCEAPEKGLKEISCMVCFKPGHQHCVPIPSPSDPRVFCPNCAEGHRLSDCPYVSSHGGRNFRKAKCYICDETGHIAADCPRQGVFCYACGEEGHFSRDCTNKRRGNGGGGNTGNNHGFGSVGNNGGGKKSRKRARDYYESEESDYLSPPYQGRGGGGNNNNKRGNSTGRTVVLNAALPSGRYYGGGGGGNRANNSGAGGGRYHQGSYSNNNNRKKW